ncbi:MAG: DUF6263 family protein [Ferruginibacter sp.]
MKKICTVFLCFSTAAAFAQNVKLETGKKITAVTTATMEMDMGMGGQMKISSVSTGVISIIGTDDKMYKGENTLTKMKISQDGAGQTNSYDSENPADRNSEMGKQAGSMLNLPGAILIDKTDGTVKDANPEKALAGGNPMEDLMGASKSPSATAAAAFFVLPEGKKAGDKWTDSTSEAGIKVIKYFELQSVKDGIATVLLEALTKGSIEKEAESMQMTITINGITKSTILSDLNTGLVKSNTSNGNIEGTLDMMGQSMPITMTINSVTRFE